MPFNIQGPELILILIIALVVLGPGRLPEVGSALGRSIREFRKAATDVKDATSLEPANPPPAAPNSLAAPAAPNVLASPSTPAGQVEDPAAAAPPSASAAERPRVGAVSGSSDPDSPAR